MGAAAAWFLTRDAGVRIVDPKDQNGFDPRKLTVWADVALEQDFVFPVPGRAEGEAFVAAAGDGARLVFDPAKDGWFIVRRKGTVVKVARAARLNRYVAGQIPSSWDPVRYGIPKDLVEQVDRTTLYNLIATVEAFVAQAHAASCDALYRCGTGNNEVAVTKALLGDAGRCASLRAGAAALGWGDLNELPATVRLGKARYNGVAALRCLTRLRATCDVAHPLAEMCGDVFAGTVAAGAGIACIDTGTDRSNCGRCGEVCPDGQVCSQGACLAPCTGGRTLCGSACRDLQTDVAHCGACGNACPSGQSCVARACTAAAPGSLNTGRSAFGSGVALDGRVFVFGGYNTSYLSSTEMFDPATNVWTYRASMPVGVARAPLRAASKRAASGMVPVSRYDSSVATSQGVSW